MYRAAAVTVTAVHGPAIAEFINDLARLRIEVFREFPYLYDGDPDYETRYLQTYLASPDAVLVLARDGKKVVGASTALPMEHESIEFQQPFLDHGYDIREIFYCGESVLEKDYRGRGIGSAFYAARESHAAALGRFRYLTFCAVDRAADDPRRPRGYQPLDAYWRRRGFEQQPELTTRFSWQEIGGNQATFHTMTFWLKKLTT